MILFHLLLERKPWCNVGGVMEGTKCLGPWRLNTAELFLFLGSPAPLEKAAKTQSVEGESVQAMLHSWRF